MNAIALWHFATSRIGLIIIAIGSILIFYEGLPVPQFIRNFPVIGPIVQDLTDGRVDRAAREARRGYVLEVEKIAAEHRAAELERQLKAGRRALDAYAEIVKELRLENEIVTADIERRISEYESQLAAANRDCPLDQSDIDFLR